MNEQQLSALIDAAVREAVERTTRELTARHEADTEGLRRKRDELLDKVAKRDGDGQKPTQVTHDNFDEWLAGLDQRLAKLKEENARLTGQSTAPVAAPVRAHTISREEARDARVYQEAKARAKAAGVELEIVDANAPAQGRRSSPVALIHDEIGGVLHANVRLVEKLGQQRMRQLASEKGASLRAFRDVTELPDEIAARHAEIIASGDRSNLLGDSQ